MEFTRTSPLSGKTVTLDLPVTVPQYLAWKKGALIQEVMPHLEAEEREFIISGYIPGEFDKMFDEEMLDSKVEGNYRD